MACYKTLSPLGLALLGLTSACEPGASMHASPDSSVSVPDGGPPSADTSMDAASGFQEDASVDDAAVDGATVSELDAAGPINALPDAGPIDDGLPTGPNVFKMIAPSLCTTRLGRMFDCHFDSGHIDAESVPDTGEFKTRVTGHTRGDCTTQYHIRVWLSAEGIEPFKYNMFDNKTVWLRRDDSAAVASVAIEDASAFTANLNLDPSCRIWLELELNVAIQPSSQM